MKLTIHYGANKPVKAVGKHQCRLLDFTFHYRGWHSYKQDKTTKQAVAGLQRRGAIEVQGDQFRFTEAQQ